MVEQLVVDGLEWLAGYRQLVASGLVFSSIVILGSIGLALVYSVGDFPNFAHGDLLTIGAYTAIVVNVMLDVHLAIGFVVAMIVTALVALGTDKLIYRPLEGKPIELLITSIGVAFAYRALLLMGFGPGSMSYDAGGRGGIQWVRDTFGVTITPRQAVIILVTLVLVSALHIILQYTTLGRMMRATAENKDLARVSGIRTQRVLAAMWLIGGALAGAGGVFLGLELVIRPRIGFSILLVLFAAVILGGIGSVYGAMLGGFVIGMAHEMAGLFGDISGALPLLPEFGSEYGAVVAFVLMILILIVKPSGIMGGKTSA